MTGCFKQCRTVQTVLILVGLLLGTACVVFLEQHLVVRVLFAVLAFSLCLVIGRLMAARVANRAHSELLAVLYQCTDPDTFLARYTPLPQKCRGDSAERIMTTNYLASGHAARGDFKAAAELLQPLSPQTLKFHRGGLLALTWSNLCQFYLWTGDADRAQEQLQKMESLSRELSGRAPAVSRSLGHNVRLFGEHLHLLRGEPVDADYIREEMELSANPLYKYSMQLLLARALDAEGVWEQARPLLEELAEQNSSLFATREANRLLQSHG